MSFLGIDIGTSSICGVVYDNFSNQLVTRNRKNSAALNSPHTWEKQQDAEAILLIVEELIQEFIAIYPDIEAMGLSGQMHGIVYVDKEGRAVTPLFTWQDDRGRLPYLSGKSYATHLSEQTGKPFASGFGLVTHFYNDVNGLIPERAVKFCTIMDYVAMRLCGNKEPHIESSNAASLGLFDVKTASFHQPDLDRAGIDSSFLPGLVDSFTALGYYHDIAVYVPIGDNQASFLGSVHTLEHSLQVTVGTSSQLSVFSPEYLEISPLETRPLPGGGYLLVGAALCGGDAFVLLKQFFEETLSLLGGPKLSEEEIYRRLVSLPYHKKATGDLRVTTLFDGTRQDPDARGAITQISRSNWTPQALILGFIRGMAQELYDFYQQLPESLRKEKSLLIGSGNGIRKNPLLHEALKEYFGYPLQLSECREEAALGACLCGMIGEGFIKDFADFWDRHSPGKSSHASKQKSVQFASA